jgi:23S rRNA pseudouridine2604 synthase
MAVRRLRVLVAQECQVPVNEAVKYINEGRVQVNDEPATTQRLVSDQDVVTLDGNVISNKIQLTYILFYKPRGIECTMNENISDNLLTVFKHYIRLYPVGRLDKESEGLLLMINDGKLYHEIAHADSKKEKEYYVEVHKPITEEFISSMRAGVKILNTVTDPCEVFPDEKSDHAFRIVLKQGMNRQIRRMSYNLGFSVHKLVRTRIMHLTIEGLEPGEWRDLTTAEMEPLLQLGR